MTDFPDDIMEPTTPRMSTAAPKKCRRHWWGKHFDRITLLTYEVCVRCGKPKDEAVARRGRNNRSRGGREELAVARLLGGEKVGPLGLPHDVALPGYMRIQTKKLLRWPSLAKVIEWLDAMQPGDDVRGVTVADTPGPGGRTRRLLIFDLDEYARWHGGK